MNKNWFETSVRYDRTMDNGLVKTVTEKYLVEATTPSEAELHITNTLAPLTSGQFAVKSVIERKYSEFIGSVSPLGNDYYFCATVEFITFDEQSGKEKKVANKFLVMSDNIDNALSSVHRYMRDSLSDYTISKLELTKIIDVYTK